MQMFVSWSLLLVALTREVYKSVLSLDLGEGRWEGTATTWKNNLKARSSQVQYVNIPRSLQCGKPNPPLIPPNGSINKWISIVFLNSGFAGPYLISFLRKIITLSLTSNSRGLSRRDLQR